MLWRRRNGSTVWICFEQTRKAEVVVHGVHCHDCVDVIAMVTWWRSLCPLSARWWRRTKTSHTKPVSASMQRLLFIVAMGDILERWRQLHLARNVASDLSEWSLKPMIRMTVFPHPIFFAKFTICYFKFFDVNVNLAWVILQAILWPYNLLSMLGVFSKL